MNKAALSLTFYDDNLYENLVVPYKNNRMLTELVIKLLTVYFYDESVRKIVDGASDTDGIIDSYDEYFRDVNALMACLGASQDSAEDILSSGTSSILKSAEKRNINEDIWGEGVPKVSKAITDGIATATKKMEENSGDSLGSKEYNELKGQIGEISEIVKNLMRMMSSVNSFDSNGVQASEQVTSTQRVSENLEINTNNTTDSQANTTKFRNDDLKGYGGSMISHESNNCDKEEGRDDIVIVGNDAYGNTQRTSDVSTNESTSINNSQKQKTGGAGLKKLVKSLEN